jgi:hypothetical protein
VVAELLHGTATSFAATPPAAGRAPYLVVTIAAAAAKPVAEQPEAVPVPAESEEPEPAEAAALPAEEAPAETPAPATTADRSPVLPLTLQAPVTAGQPASFVVTPFSDANGKPLITKLDPAGSSAPGQAVLPYSDEIGNPIVVQITNEPLSLTPFTGPDGEAWPAPVTQPNQKLEYPGPTTVPSPKPEGN